MSRVTSLQTAPSQPATGGQPLSNAPGPMQAALDASPVQAAQRERIARVFGPAAQRQAQPNRTGMPDALKSGIESLSGMDMSDVRVHRNSQAPQQLSAHAYAQGNDIHLAPGQERHLPHEAWHVVQQRQGRVQPTMEVGGASINDSPALEHEADVMGGRALSAPVQGKALEGGAGPQGSAPPVTQAVMQMGWGRTLGYGALGLGAGLLAAGLLPAVASAGVLGTAGALTGLALGHLTDPNDKENEVEQGHDGDEEGGLEEDEFPVAEPKDVDRGEDPELYRQVEELTLSFSRLSIHDFQQSPVHSRGGKNNYQFKFQQPYQLKRGAGPSYQEGYESSSHGGYKEVEYTRNGKGTFAFDVKPKLYKGGKWADPVKHSSWVDLAHGSKDKSCGITAGGRKVKLVSASRGVHFGIANRIKKYDDGNNSPDGWTWHHLPEPYKMVLVDRQVHRKHGHNGGKFLWT